MEEDSIENKPENSEENKEKIISKLIEDEMKTSYLDYAMSVIVGRALPDIRDGLKPVHRRILFAMNDMGMQHNRPFKKSARIVGEVLGKYHPHGDSAVYDSMVRLAQPWSMRYTLIQGQGNFGSIDGDSAAAMRYTEARMNRLSEELIEDIEKDTVDMMPNFDSSLKEPIVLPSKYPNLLVNGSSGIAVGMATNIPPHNMQEVCSAIIAQIDDPNITIEELSRYVKGPDFPTGGLICGSNGITNAYNTGRGKVVLRAKTKIIDSPKKRIMIEEIPYMVNKAEMIAQIAELVKDKKIEGISDIRDESDRLGMSVVIELKSDANPEIVLNHLYMHSRMQVTFGIIFLALVKNQPKVLNLKQLIYHFIEHRKEVVTRRTRYELKKAQERAHILEGLIIALDNIDQVIQTIKKAKSAAIAKEQLTSGYSLTDIQAQAILDMKLQRLTGLEQDKIRQEHKDLLRKIEEYKDILADITKILAIIKQELSYIMQKYGDERKTRIIDMEMTELDMEDLIDPEDMVITITHSGYIKRQPLSNYREQKRGGKGIIATTTKDEDFIEDIFIANTHSYLLFFTDKGKVYWKKVYYIPEGSRQSKGKAIVNLVEIEKDEKINAIVPVKDFSKDKNVFMATIKGIVKKTPLESFSNPRKGGIIAISLDDGNQLVGVKLTNGNDDIVLATKKGMAIRFNENNVRRMGRNAAGVRGIKLKPDDEVIGMVTPEKDSSILSVTENGFGKRTDVEEYRQITRGGTGVINIQCSSRNGNVVSISAVKDDDDLMFISRSGILIRTSASGISKIGRNTQGVRLMKLAENDSVVSLAKIAQEDIG